ncbi:MAG: tRNA (cytidine(34)-2'-O)-methyltransferase [Gammaproteobacteria bacterium]
MPSDTIPSHTPPFHIALLEPEIPPNTGNIRRLCANIGAQLHLIRPLGFQLHDRSARRAAMDYANQVDYHIHDSYEHFRSSLSQAFQEQRVFALTTRGQTTYTQCHFQAGDVFLFGPESRGLPSHALDSLRPENQLRLPMQADSRSINLSNAVAIMAYEAWRQMDFCLNT